MQPFKIINIIVYMQFIQLF